MKTTPLARLALPVALLAALSLSIAACSSGAAASPPPSGSPPPSDQVAPSDPDGSVSGPSDPGAGGGIGGGSDNIVLPQPGTIDPHPVAVEKIEPSIDGRRVTVKLTWTSGVAPCYVLDEVIVSRDGNDIALTVVEGTGEQGAMCIEIAQQKATIVDLGELEPGEYTISATDSDIPPVTITVT
jgi:hypothetical protein